MPRSVGRRRGLPARGEGNFCVLVRQKDEIVTGAVTLSEVRPASSPQMEGFSLICCPKVTVTYPFMNFYRADRFKGYPLGSSSLL